MSLDVNDFIVAGPTPLEIVEDDLRRQLRVVAYVQGQRLTVRGMFSKLPLVRQILEQHGYPRKRWPKPRPEAWNNPRPSARHFQLVVTAPDKEASAVVIKLTAEQRRRLKTLAGGRSLRATAKSVFECALAAESAKLQKAGEQ